jgi:hypothetical protein
VISRSVLTRSLLLLSVSVQEVVRKSSDKDKRVLRTARKEAKHIKSTKKRRKKMAGF